MLLSISKHLIFFIFPPILAETSVFVCFLNKPNQTKSKKVLKN